MLAGDVEGPQDCIDGTIVEHDFLSVENDFEEACSEQSQLGAHDRECSERDKSHAERLDAAGETEHLAHVYCSCLLVS